MLALRPYQTKILDDIYQAWGTGHQNVCAVMPTGAGKTVAFGTVLSQESGIRFAIAHRQELVSQMSMTLAKMGVEHCVLATDNLIKYIIRMQVDAFGKRFHDPRAKCFVTGVQTLINRAGRLPIDRASLWVLDECFPAGTLVDGKPIERYKVGDSVLSFDEKTKQIIRQKVTRIFKKIKPENMVRINTNGHHVLYCTLEHPFYTKRGWVKASELTKKDEVLNVSLHELRKTNRCHQRTSKILAQKNGKNILRKKMRVGVQIKKWKKSKTENRNAKLFGMWKRNRSIRSKTFLLQKNEQGLLFKNMLKNFLFHCVIKDNGENKSAIRISPNEKKQPYVQRRIKGKNESIIKKNTAFSENKRRERKAAHRSRIKTFRYFWGHRFSSSMHCKNRPLQRRVGFPYTLQNRLWKPGTKNRHRDRWGESLLIEKKSAGSEKRRIFNWVGVEDVSIYESRNFSEYQRNNDNNYVYNLEVENTNTYLVNGFVVHNCHHSLRSNIWGKALSMFPDSCRGLGVTATPNRADGRGIGRHADGLFDTMVEGPNMRYLIDSGYLTDYRIFGPYTDIDLSSVAISAATGDYSKPKLVAAVRKSRIVGDVVKAYQQFAAGKIGVVFVPDVQTGEDMTVSFCAAGIPAKCVHAGTPDAERQNATGALKRGDLKILTNVDIFGEGYDLPAIECVIFARPTESYPLYVQQFGRGLRTMPGKEKAVIIDLVKNIERHGKLPDSPQTWSLDSRERKASAKDPDLIPIRTCRECLSIYESWQKDCPFCGWKYAPLPMGTIEQVEGVITELDPSVLAAMRGEVSRIDGPPPYVTGSAQQAINAQWKRRQDAQHGLREAMSVWAGYQRTAGQSDDVIMRRFYKIFGTDVITAQTFGRRDAEELTLKLMESLR